MWKRPQQRPCKVTSDLWQFHVAPTDWAPLPSRMCVCVWITFTMPNFAVTNESCSAKEGLPEGGCRCNKSSLHVPQYLSVLFFSTWVAACAKFADREQQYRRLGSVASGARIKPGECLTRIRVEQRVSGAFGECVPFTLLDVTFAFAAATWRTHEAALGEIENKSESRSKRLFFLPIF